MGFEPTTLRDLVGCSNHWATGDSMVSKGVIWVFDWNCITQSHSQMMSMADMNSLTASRSHLKAYQRCNQPSYLQSEYYKEIFK